MNHKLIYCRASQKEFSYPTMMVCIVLCKGKKQYLLTCKVSRYCFLPLHSSIIVDQFQDFTFMLLNCILVFLINLKLELLTQFPASNDETFFYLWKIGISKIEIFH